MRDGTARNLKIAKIRNSAATPYNETLPPTELPLIVQFVIVMDPCPEGHL